MGAACKQVRFLGWLPTHTHTLCHTAHSHTNAHTRRAAAATGETPEQKIERLEQELAAMMFERDAWKKESRKFSAASKTATEALKGFSDRNVDRVVAAFVEDLKAGA